MSVPWFPLFVPVPRLSRGQCEAQVSSSVSAVVSTFNALGHLGNGDKPVLQPGPRTEFGRWTCYRALCCDWGRILSPRHGPASASWLMWLQVFSSPGRTSVSCGHGQCWHAPDSAPFGQAGSSAGAVFSSLDWWMESPGGSLLSRATNPPASHRCSSSGLGGSCGSPIASGSRLVSMSGS